MSKNSLRPHHGLCISFFEGKGYDDHFTQNMYNVISNLSQNPEITLSTDEDIICKACPHNKASICDCNERVKKYDQMVLKLCDVRSGDVMSWKIYKALVYNKIIKTGKLSSVCGDCQWESICSKK